MHSIRILKKYFPVWKEPKKLSSVLFEMKNCLTLHQPNSMGITMTAELSDVFQTKREGVNFILNSAVQAFHDIPFSILNTKGDLISIKEAKANP